jgi:hypothetical protein
VSGLTDIQEAIERLSPEERAQLWDWFQASEADGFEEDEELLAALDQAERSIREGKGVPMEDVLRRLSQQWGIK